MKIKKFNEGITKTDNKFIFDFEKDSPDDILSIATVQIKQTNIGDSVYWFGYEFNSSISSDIRNRFIHWIKGLYSKENRPSSAELYRFIDRPIAQLSKKVPFVTFDSIVYPHSNRSNLVNSIIKVVNNYIDHDSNKLTIELVKNLPQRVEFDLGALKAACGNDRNRYNQMERQIAQVLLPKIKTLSYFSLATAVKNTKYRPYVKKFLNFKTEEDRQAFEALNNPKTLIIDDINTSGTTINEIVRIIKKVNPKAEIYIFTLLGKDFSI